MLTGVILGAFTPSFFLRARFERPEPTPFIMLHGWLMTGWMLGFLGQSGLVALGRTGWHRRLGYAAVGLAALVVAVGCMATLASAAREVHAHGRAMPFQLNVLGLELAQMALFGGFVAAGIVWRARVDLHKRLMLLATLCVLPNAIVRLSLLPAFSALSSNLLILDAWTAIVAALVAVDAARTRRLHRAWAGALLAAGALYAAQALSLTPAWVSFWVRSLA